MNAAAAASWAQYMPRAIGLRDSGLACLGAGEQHGLLTSTRRRTLASHALVIISAGTGYFRCSTLDTRIGGPSWFWLFPGTWHEYGPDRVGWTEHWVLFEGVATRGYASYGAWSQSRPLTAGELPAGELTACFSALRVATAAPGQHGQLVAAGLVHRLIGAAAAACKHTEQHSAVQALVQAAAENLSVAERAARLGLRSGQLRKEVRDSTGVTPHELVLRTRLVRAQELLANSNLTVTEIAAQVGYDDPAYFSRLFTRRVGTSPIQFRRQEHRR